MNKNYTHIKRYRIINANELDYGFHDCIDFTSAINSCNMQSRSLSLKCSCSSLIFYYLFYIFLNE